MLSPLVRWKPDHATTQFNPYGGGFNPNNPQHLYDMARGGMRRGAPQRFDEIFRCYPIVMAPGAERPELNYGSKIFLPPSALEKVSRLHVQWPIMLEIINGEKETHTHGGVLEFVAEEGRAYLPQWVCPACPYGQSANDKMLTGIDDANSPAGCR
jgi:ubiquitin fusion degradation protein 1